MLKPLSQVAEAMPRSGIREIMDLAWAHPNPIHLEVGEPNFDTPPHVIEAVIAAARAGETKYTPNAGYPWLREAVAARHQQRTGVVTDADNVTITPGSIASLASSMLALFEPGDEALVPDPAWPNYEMTLLSLHVVPVRFSLPAENQFEPDFEELGQLVTPRTKAMMLNSPSNPIGKVFSAETIGRFMEFARQHDLYVISDEIYEDIVFDESFASVAPLDTDGRAIVVGGVSKSYAMTGFRVGWSIAAPQIAALIAKLQEPYTSCTCGISQRAAEAALNGPQECMQEMRQAYHARRDVALDVLRAAGLYQYTPGGAFYLLIDIGSTGMDSYDFARQLLADQSVAVAPGGTFGRQSQQQIRISFASSPGNIREGVERICKFIQQR